MIIDGHLHLTDPVDCILEEMDRFGVDMGIVTPSGLAQGEKVVSLESAKRMMASIARSRSEDSGFGAETVRQWNRETARAISPHSDRLRGFAKVDLRLSEIEIAGIMEDGLELGLIGFGEILGAEEWPGRFGFLLSRSSELGGYPVFVHGDYPVGREAIGNIAEWAAAVPGTPVILGHIGGDFWIDAVEYAAAIGNLFLDLSEAVNLAAVRTAAAAVPDKVFYGSDYPWETMGVGIQRIRGMKADKAVEDKILSGNIESLLKRAGAL